MKPKNLELIAFVLVIVGAINWGLIAFFEYDLVSEIFGFGSTFARVIFGLVGLAGVYLALMRGRKV
ncbi:DUF378 domain-containing protein [Candidatus Saccharibacteria bacterium]|nr:DUF378 domain-containing protein [Candidatus Saccharibacteria bacterium]